MITRTPRQLLRSISTARQRGSILILTLLLVGVLAIAVSAMLLNVRQFSRSTSDKMAYEEAYHAALGGVQMTKAWLMDSGLARAQLGTTLGNTFENITTGAVHLVATAVDEKYNQGDSDWAETRTAGQVSAAFATYEPGIPDTSIDGGTRRVLIDLTNTPVRFMNDMTTPTTYNMISGSTRLRSRVTRIRVTTPYCAVGASVSGDETSGHWVRDSLLKTSVIVEAEAQTYSAGSTKTRWVQQKLLLGPTVYQGPTSWDELTTELVIPPSNGNPDLSPGGSIISGGPVTIQGNSHMNVWWGPVQVNGNIDILDLSFGTSGSGSNSAISLTAGDKYYGAGLEDSYGAPVSDTDPTLVEKWLRWQCSGSFKDNHGNDIMPNLSNGTQITDLFVQIQNQSLDGGGKDYDISRTNLSGFGYTAQNGEGVLYDADDDGNYIIGTGAFVQHVPSIGTTVQTFLSNDLSYDSWKQYAIAQNGYAKPGTGVNSGKYVDSLGRVLYVKSDRTLTLDSTGNTVFTSLKQISMKNQIPSDGNTYNITDQIFFLDTKEGTQNGTQNTVTLNSQDDFFWKGLLYVNGSVSTSGGGAFPSIWAQNPEQYAQWPGEVGTGKGYTIDNCYVDGIVYATGSVTRTGNAAIYGTMVCGTGADGAGTPNVFYNSRNKGGLFQPGSPYIEETTIHHEGVGTIADTSRPRYFQGPIQEMDAWATSVSF
jgi:hypothetical protein